MKDNQIKLIKSLLGKDIFQDLEKAELYNSQTNTTNDPKEIAIALQIVPRVVLTYLISHLKSMQIGDIKELTLPFAEGRLSVNKLSNDVYSGEVFSTDHKKLYHFKYRSLPAIGLVLMSTFELYDMSEMNAAKENVVEVDQEQRLQALIDEKLKFHALIRDVVDQRIAEREVLQQMLLNKLKSAIFTQQPVENEMKDKKLKLKEFLESRQKKIEDTGSEELDKSDSLSCPDCTGSIYKSGDAHIKCCICFGEFHNKDIKFEKKEGRVSFKFPKNFDKENIDMLLDTIKSNKR